MAGKQKEAAAETAEGAGERSRGRLKRAVRATAPTIARQLGGPLAGLAVEALSRAIFGKDKAAEDALAEAIEDATADQIIAIRRAEQEFEIALRQAGVEEQKIDAGDRASARQRQVTMEDWTPSVLGALIIAGFFLTLGVMVARRLPDGAETEFSIMLGALATMTAAVVNYFFGSSAGSREKTKLLSRKGDAE